MIVSSAKDGTIFVCHMRHRHLICAASSRIHNEKKNNATGGLIAILFHMIVQFVMMTVTLMGNCCLLPGIYLMKS